MELPFEFTLSNSLQAVVLYLLSCLTLSTFILGLFLASNHKFVEDGKDKALVLVGFKEFLDKTFIRLDSSVIAKALKNWLVLLAGLAGILYGSVKFLQTNDLNFLGICFLFVSWTLYKKSFGDIGVFVLGCYRCMSTFWIALPMMGAGLWFGHTANTLLFWLIPFSIFTTAVVSAIVSYTYMNYDQCKLNVSEMKREREIYKAQLEICEQEKEQQKAPAPVEVSLK